MLLKQIPGHQLVGNDNGHLRRQRVLWLADSFKMK